MRKNQTRRNLICAAYVKAHIPMVDVYYQDVFEYDLRDGESEGIFSKGILLYNRGKLFICLAQFLKERKRTSNVQKCKHIPSYYRYNITLGLVF
jgi:hypothetical protein